ncbi:MAG: VWA domain-containing protein [Verrucomicrobiales bacterium]
MKFAFPYAALALLPVALSLWLGWGARNAHALEFSSMRSVFAAGRSMRQRLAWLPAILGVAALCLTVIALARPQIEVYERAKEREGIAIEILVDISSSMDMRMDYSGEESTRLEVAKKVLESFVLGDGDELPGRPDDLVGIITFARYADTVCPLTLGHRAVVYFARNLEINDRPNEDGTAYGDATALAAARMKTLEENLWQRALEDEEQEVKIKSKIIVLLTDGENNCGRHLPLESAAMAQKWGIRVYTISLGEPPPPVKVEVEQGEEVIEAVPERSAAEQTLEKMAEMTGGIFRTAHDFDSLQAVYKEIDRLERSEMHSTAKKLKADVFGYFVWAALALLAFETLLRATWLRRIP